MKRILLALLFLSGIAVAQQGSPILVRSSGVPIGACAPFWQYEDISTNPVDFYLCPAGSWIKAGSASGSATWGSITGTLSAQTDLQTALNLKSPLASPTFTGVPAAPTATLGTNTTQVATTAFVLANAGSANCTVAGSAGDLQKNNGSSGCAASSLNDNGTRVSGIEPLQLGDGTNAAPSFAFTSETAMGMFRHGSDVLGFSTAGGEAFEAFNVGGTAGVFIPGFGAGNSIIGFLSGALGSSSIFDFEIEGSGVVRANAAINDSTPTGILEAAAFRGIAGTAAAPSLSFTSTTNTGFFSPATNQIGVTVAGTAQSVFYTGGLAYVNGTGPTFETGVLGTSIVGGISRVSDKVLGVSSDGTAGATTGQWRASAFEVGGTKFTLSANACSADTTLGGGSAGSFVSRTTGACTVTILMGDSATAPNGWHCTFEDHTTPANFISQTGAADTTHCSMTGTTVTGDLISFAGTAY